MEAEEEDEDGVFYVNALTGKEEEGEGEEEGKVNATRAEGQEEGERGGWWTSDQSWSEMETEEEDEEEFLYLSGVTAENYAEEKKQAGNNDLGEGSAPSETPSSKKEGRREDKNRSESPEEAKAEEVVCCG
jgi:hypothetical protein